MVRRQVFAAGLKTLIGKLAFSNRHKVYVKDCDSLEKSSQMTNLTTRSAGHGHILEYCDRLEHILKIAEQFHCFG